MSENPEYEDIVTKIKDVQDGFYSTNKKKMFFKKAQKLDCANLVAENIPLDQLISKTMFIVPNSNKVYIDYTFFKLYANPDNFSEVAENIVFILKKCIELSNIYQMHLNLDSFTVSALERYKPVIIHFCNKCLSHDTQFVNSLEKFYIYNVPKNFDHMVKLLKGFIDKDVYKKVQLLDSSDSTEIVKEFESIRDGAYGTPLSPSSFM